MTPFRLVHGCIAVPIIMPFPLFHQLLQKFYLAFQKFCLVFVALLADASRSRYWSNAMPVLGSQYRTYFHFRS